MVKELTMKKSNKKRLAELKEKLEQERDLLLQQIQDSHNVKEIISHGDLVDQSNDYSERENLLGLAEHDRNRLLSINEALSMIDDGTYGICAMCQEPIPEARLIAMPTAKHCIQCQTKAENYG